MSVKLKNGTVLDQIACRSDSFESLTVWAAYPARNKILANGSYTLIAPLVINCESLIAEGTVNITVTGDFIGIYFGTSIRTLLKTLTSSISKGLTSLIINDVKEGDVLCLYDPRDFSWSGYRPYYRSGEFVKVIKYLNGVAYFNGGIKSKYMSGTQVYKIETKKISVCGNFIFNFPSYNSNSMAMQFEQVENGNFDNLSVISHSAPYAVQFKRCFNLKGAAMSLTQESEITTGLDYACYICNSQNIDFRGIFCSERHSVTITGNEELCGIVNRFISINGDGSGAIMTTGRGGVAAADWHGNTEKCRYGGYIQGLACGGSNNSAAGAYIDHVPNRPDWPTILATETKSIEFDLSNTHISGVGDPSINRVFRGCVDFGGNSKSFGINTTEPGTLNLSGATITSPASQLIEIRNRGSQASHKVNLTGVTANALPGKYTVRIAPATDNDIVPPIIGVPPTDVMMSGFTLLPGTISQINHLDEVNVHGVSLSGRSTITIPAGSVSTELVINFPSSIIGNPKGVHFTLTKEAHVVHRRVEISSKYSTPTRFSVIACVDSNENLTIPMTVQFLWTVVW